MMGVSMAFFSPQRDDLRGQPHELTGRERMLAREARFSKWDGSQTVPDLEADEILEALADDLMSEGDVEAALRRLMERGWQSGDPTRRDLSGLQDLMQRLQQRRRELLERYNLGDTLSGIREELESIVQEERTGVQRRLDDAARPPSRPTARRAASDPTGGTSRQRHDAETPATATPTSDRRRDPASRAARTTAGAVGPAAASSRTDPGSALRPAAASALASTIAAAALHAPRHGREAARPARRAAAGPRRPDPAASRSTTSWSRARASGSTRCSNACATRCSTST